MNTKEYQLTVLGMGYVGLTLAAVYAQAGFETCGVDIDKDVVASLKKGVPPFHEQGLPALLKETQKQLTFSTEIPTSKKKRVFVIAVGTSIDEHKMVDYRHLDQAVADIALKIGEGDVVLLRSTVIVGTTRQRVVPLLEDMTGLKVGVDFFVGFAPERTVEGRAIEELRTLPQIIASFTDVGQQIIGVFFQHVSEEIVVVESLECAEMVKLISNAYRDTVFAFANSVAIAAAEHNVDSHSLINAANHGYERNGIPLPSPGVGGYCLTKDPYLFAESGRSMPELADFVRAARAINDSMPHRVVDIVEKFIESHKLQSPSITIVGLAFKSEPVTSDVRFSPSIDVVRSLKYKGYTNLAAFDRHVKDTVYTEHNLQKHKSLADVAAHSDVLVFMHGNKLDLDPEVVSILKKRAGNQLLLDTWNVYANQVWAKEDGIVYSTLSAQWNK